MPNSEIYRGKKPRGKAAKPSGNVAKKKKSIVAASKKVTKAKRPPLPPKTLDSIYNTSCGGRKNNVLFEVDYTLFTRMGVLLWNLFFKRGTGDPHFAPGELGVYLKSCYAWYLKINGAWAISDDDIQNCGSFCLPRGVCLIFRQCSEFKDPNFRFTFTMSSSVAKGTVFSSVLKWPVVGGPGSLALDFDASVEPVVVTDVGSLTTLTDSQLREISDLISATWQSTTIVNDLTWGADSAELFLGTASTSLAKIYPWSGIMSCILHPNTRFAGYMVTQDSSFDMFMALGELVMEHHHDARTVCGVLKNNGYDPMYFRVVKVPFNEAYAVQTLVKLWQYTVNDLDISDPLFYSFVCMFWSYVSAYLPVASVYDNLIKMPNYALKEVKMPWPITYMASQMWCKNGNTMFVPLVEVTNNWTQVYKTANTGSYVGWNSPGFITNSVPGDVVIAGVTWSSGDVIANTTLTSWTTFNKMYAEVSIAHPSLFVIAAPMEDELVDCGCLARFVPTTFIDDYVSPVLGILSPQVIAELSCPAQLPLGSCSTAMALTWRWGIVSGITYVSKSRTRCAVYNDSIIEKVISQVTTRNSGGTSLLLNEVSKRGVNKYVNKQASGGYEYLSFDAASAARLISNWAGTSPYVRNFGKDVANAIAENMPEYVTADSVFSIMGKLGTAGITAVAAALTTRKMGVARGR